MNKETEEQTTVEEPTVEKPTTEETDDTEKDFLNIEDMIKNISPSTIKNIADQLGNIEVGAEEEVEKKTKKRGRKKKIDKKPSIDISDIIPTDMVTESIGILTNGVFDRIGWEKLTKKEEEAFSKVSMNLLNKHVGIIVDKIEEITFLIVVGGIIIKRAGKSERPEPEQK